MNKPTYTIKPLYLGEMTRYEKSMHTFTFDYEETFKKMDKIDFKVILPGHDMKVLEHSVYPY